MGFFPFSQPFFLSRTCLKNITWGLVHVKFFLKTSKLSTIEYHISVVSFWLRFDSVHRGVNIYQHFKDGYFEYFDNNSAQRMQDEKGNKKTTIGATHLCNANLNHTKVMALINYK